jgi:hypothetical protein
VAQLVEELRYEPEGRGFDCRLGHWGPSGRSVALGSTQPLTKMSTRIISWGEKAAGADRLKIFGASAYWNTKDLSRPVWNRFTVLYW